MKKIVSIVLLILVLGTYLSFTSYIKGVFDYHIAQLISYILIWLTTLFVISIFASSLGDINYKFWLLISSVLTLLSLLIAYNIGDGNGAIISTDGKLATWFFAGLYSVVSIIYIIVNYINIKKSNV